MTPKTRPLLPLLALALLPAPVARAETTSCTPITSVPTVITAQGIYCFTGNLATSIAGGRAIDIQANNVTLDLNGYKLGGLAAGPSTDAIGIYARDRQNVTIRNGNVRGFRFGIELDASDAFSGVSQGHLVEDMLVDQNTHTGIVVVGRGNVVRRNRVVATGGSTLVVVAAGILVGGPAAEVIDNDVSGTFASGPSDAIALYSAAGAVVENNRLRGDLSGEWAFGIFIFQSQNVLLVGNRIGPTDNGIYFDPGSGGSTGKYMDTLTSGSATPFTGGTAVGVNN